MVNINLKIYIKYLKHRMQPGDHHKIKIYSKNRITPLDQQSSEGTVEFWGMQGRTHPRDVRIPSVRTGNEEEKERIQKWLEGEEGKRTFLRSLLLMRQDQWQRGKSASFTHARAHTHTHTSDCSVYWGRSSPEAHGAETFPTKHSIVSVSKFMSIFRESSILLQSPDDQPLSARVCACVCVPV